MALPDMPLQKAPASPMVPPSVPDPTVAGDKDYLRRALLLVLVLLAYGNTLVNDFTMDDELYIVRNPQVTSPSLRELFTPNKATDLFRPITFTTFALNRGLSGARPFGFHLLNLMLHAAVAILLYLLLQMLLRPSPHARNIALAASLLFAVHPIHTEAVASIVGRGELLAAGFLLAAWILHLRDREVPALLCFVLAMASKESAVVFLALVLMGDYALGKWKTPLRYARIAVITLLYVALLWKMAGGHFGRAAYSPLDNPLVILPPVWRILNALRVAWRYVGLQIYPGTLSCDYSFNQIPLFVNWRLILPAAVAAVAFVAAWIWAVWNRKRGLVLAGGIYLAAFATTANILVPTGTIMGERLAYLPSVGFCLLVALAWNRLLTWNWLREQQRTVAWAVLAVVVAALGVRTVARNRDWKDNLTLYSAAVRAVPHSAKMHYDLGNEYLARQRFDEARVEFQAALHIYPSYPDALMAYGLLEYRAGHYDAAEHIMRSGLEMSPRQHNPDYDDMLVNLAALLLQTGRTDGALELLNREVAESPKYARGWSNRAAVHYQRGETALAATDAEMALRLDPANTQAQNLRRLLSSPAPVASPN